MMAMALALAVGLSTPAGAKRIRKVPSSFMGVVADGPLLQSRKVDFAAELDRMVVNGVQTARTVFNWSGAQPYATFDDVPEAERPNFTDENGVPTNWAPTDKLVAGAAERRLKLLPVVLLAPNWDARHPGQFSSPPDDPQPYADFTAALVHRYGPGGAFWTEHPELPVQPIRNWQIWNEPSLRVFWSDQPFADDYVLLLRRAHDAIKEADPGASVVLAGLPNKSWTALETIYHSGGKDLFDVAAFHPFTATVGGVKTILEKNRAVMRKYGDSRKPLWVTELSWTSAKGHTEVSYGNEQTEKGQARKVTSAYTMLAKARDSLHIGRVYWYTWLSRDRQRDYPFDWAGLLRLTKKGSIERKPALTAFRKVALKLEHCRKKRGRADRCA
jgi:hypothetical protein